MGNKRDVDVLNKDEIMGKIMSLANPKYRALVSFLYLTGARITEALNVRRKDIFMKGKFAVVKLMTEKKREIQFRNIPINIEKDEKIFYHLWKHIEFIKEDANIFDISRQRAWQVLKSIGMFPHILRHFRASHLSKTMTDQQLVKFFGWVDSRPAQYYIHLKWEDLAENV